MKMGRAERELSVIGSLEERFSPESVLTSKNSTHASRVDYALPVAAGQPSDPSGPGRLRSHHDQSSGINENGSL